MNSSLPSPRLYPSSFPRCSIPFPLPHRTFSSTTHNNKTQQAKLAQSATLHISCSKTEELNLDNKEDCRLSVRHLVDRIRAIPTTQRVEFIDIVTKDDGFQTISEYNDLFMALVIADELKLALKLYSNLSSYGQLVPDCGTYSILVMCHCKNNGPNEAKRVLDHMVENGFLPNVATFTRLVNSFCKGGRLEKALEVFKIMGQVGRDPTIQTYNCLLKGLCYVGRVEEGCELLVNIKKSSKKPDVYTYTAVMDGLCKVGRSDEAMEMLDEAVGMGITPNVVIFNTLFNGYFKEGRPLEGISLLKRMKENNCVPDCISYSTLLHGLLKWGKIRFALMIYEEMMQSGFEADERLMNTLLRGLCRRSRREKGMLKDAHQLFRKMANGVCDIYPSTYELVLEALDQVVKALCMEGKLDEALSVFVLMHERGRIPSRVHFDALIDEFNRHGLSFGACNVYGAALKRGLTPQRRPNPQKALDAN